MVNFDISLLNKLRYKSTNNQEILNILNSNNPVVNKKSTISSTAKAKTTKFASSGQARRKS